MTLSLARQTVRACSANKPLSLLACAAESVASEAGSLTSHCDPDSKRSPERERERCWEGRRRRERVQKKKKKGAAEKGKEDRRETGGEGETNYERTRPQWDKRVRERGRETRERELFPLGL